MNGMLGMGMVGWVVSAVIGFVVGGIYYMTMKLQVEYVVDKRGPVWLMPVALYARLAFVAVVLVLVAVLVPREKVAAALLAGLAGALAARVLIARMVRRGQPAEGEETESDAG